MLLQELSRGEWVIIGDSGDWSCIRGVNRQYLAGWELGRLGALTDMDVPRDDRGRIMRVTGAELYKC